MLINSPARASSMAITVPLRFAPLAALVVLIAHAHKVGPIEKLAEAILWVNQVVDNRGSVRTLLASFVKVLAYGVVGTHKSGDSVVFIFPAAALV
jgi:hypothetical protein